MIDEASLYDRQIRLWGLEAQNRYVLFQSVLSFFPLSRGIEGLEEVSAEGRKGNGFGL